MKNQRARKFKAFAGPGEKVPEVEKKKKNFSMWFYYYARRRPFFFQNKLNSFLPIKTHTAHKKLYAIFRCSSSLVLAVWWKRELQSFQLWGWWIIRLKKGLITANQKDETLHLYEGCKLLNRCIISREFEVHIRYQTFQTIKTDSLVFSFFLFFFLLQPHLFFWLFFSRVKRN